MRIYVEGNSLVVESDAGDVQTIEFRDLQIRHGKRADFTEEDFNLVGRPLFAEDTGEFMIALGNGQYFNFTQSLLELYEQLREQLQLAIDRGEFQGMPGKEGDPGWTPQFTIGTVEAVSDTTKVQVTLTGTMKDPVLNFWLPIGMTEESLKIYIDALFEDKTMEVDTAVGELGDKVDVLEQEVNLVANDVERFVSKTPYNLNEEASTFGGSDLGQIVTPGRYKRESVSVGDPDTLYPDSTDKRPYTLTVEMYGENEYRQTVIYDTGRTFVRSGNVDTWTDWNESMGEEGVSRMINEEVLSKSPALMAVSSAPVTDDECIQPGVYNVSDTVGGSNFAVMQVFKLSNEVMVQVKTTYDDPNLAQKEGSVKVRLYQPSPTGSKFSEWRDVGKGPLVPEDITKGWVTRRNGSIVTDEFYDSDNEMVMTRVTGVVSVTGATSEVTVALTNTAVTPEIDEVATYDEGVCRVCLSTSSSLEDATIWELCTWSRGKDSLVIALGSILDEAKSTDNLLCVF